MAEAERAYSTTPAAVANFFLEKAKADRIALSPMKLNKLVYIASGWALAVLNRDILGGESVEAWEHGPVVPSLYHEFKHFGGGEIEDLATDIEWDDGDVFKFTPRIHESDADLRLTLDHVWSTYKDMPAGALRAFTHRPDSPWALAIAGKESERHVKIPRELTQDYFSAHVRRLIEKHKESDAGRQHA